MSCSKCGSDKHGHPGPWCALRTVIDRGWEKAESWDGSLSGLKGSAWIPLDQWEELEKLLEMVESGPGADNPCESKEDVPVEVEKWIQYPGFMVTAAFLERARKCVDNHPEWNENTPDAELDAWIDFVDDPKEIPCKRRLIRDELQRRALLQDMDSVKPSEFRKAVCEAAAELQRLSGYHWMDIETEDNVLWEQLSSALLRGIDSLAGVPPLTGDLSKEKE